MDSVVTDLAVLDLEADTCRVAQLAPGTDPETVEQRTDAPLRWQGRRKRPSPRSSAASTLERQNLVVMRDSATASS